MSAKPIRQAAICQNIVQLLIEAGSNVNAQSDDGATALMHASQEGHAEKAELLIQSGAKQSGARA